MFGLGKRKAKAADTKVATAYRSFEMPFDDYTVGVPARRLTPLPGICAGDTPSIAGALFASQSLRRRRPLFYSAGKLAHERDLRCAGGGMFGIRLIGKCGLCGGNFVYAAKQRYCLQCGRDGTCRAPPLETSRLLPYQCDIPGCSRGVENGTARCGNHKFVELCRGIKNNGEPCKVQVSNGGMWCRHHQPARVA